MRQKTYSFVHYLVAYIIFFYQLDYRFLMSSEISKENSEY